MQTKYKKILKINNTQNGFGLVDAIVSMSLLAGVITYGIYFSSLRLSTVYESNLIRSINKEIQRDTERLKSDFWGMYFVENQGQKGEYSLSNGEPLSRFECSDFTQAILDLDSWRVEGNPSNSMAQSWSPGAKRSKVFTGQPVLITRELTVNSPLNEPNLDKSIASIAYRVEWGGNNIHWLSISLGPEAHSWCYPGSLI